MTVVPSNQTGSVQDAASRRDFLKTTGAAVVATSVAATVSSARSVHAAGSDILKVGLIGCGGRGSGAASDAMRAEDNVRLTAIADLFPDQVERSKKLIAGAVGDKYAVPDSQCFSGFDAYKKVMQTDVDVEIGRAHV